MRPKGLANDDGEGLSKGSAVAALIGKFVCSFLQSITLYFLMGMWLVGN